MDGRVKNKYGFCLILIFLGKYCYVEALLCYKCSVAVEKYVLDNETIITPLCSRFKDSTEYMVQCPYSTMCVKTIFILHLQSGKTQETITRGCAQQKNTTQIFSNKKWKQEHAVQEAYSEKCNELKTDPLAVSTKIHCYCRGNLCNSASSYIFDHNILLFFFVYLYYLLCL